MAHAASDIQSLNSLYWGWIGNSSWCQLWDRPPNIESNLSNFSLLGGATERRFPSWHRVCAGIWVYAVWFIRGDPQLWTATYWSPSERLHDDAAQGGGFLPCQLYYAPGEAWSSLTVGWFSSPRKIRPCYLTHWCCATHSSLASKMFSNSFRIWNQLICWSVPQGSWKLLILAWPGCSPVMERDYIVIKWPPGKYQWAWGMDWAFSQGRENQAGRCLHLQLVVATANMFSGNGSWKR